MSSSRDKLTSSLSRSPSHEAPPSLLSSHFPSCTPPATQPAGRSSHPGPDMLSPPNHSMSPVTDGRLPSSSTSPAPSCLSSTSSLFVAPFLTGGLPWPIQQVVAKHASDVEIESSDGFSSSFPPSASEFPFSSCQYSLGRGGQNPPGEDTLPANGVLTRGGAGFPSPEMSFFSPLCPGVRVGRLSVGNGGSAGIASGTEGRLADFGQRRGEGELSRPRDPSFLPAGNAEGEALYSGRAGFRRSDGELGGQYSLAPRGEEGGADRTLQSYGEVTLGTGLTSNLPSFPHVVRMDSAGITNPSQQLYVHPVARAGASYAVTANSASFIRSPQDVPVQHFLINKRAGSLPSHHGGEGSAEERNVLSIVRLPPPSGHPAAYVQPTPAGGERAGTGVFFQGASSSSSHEPGISSCVVPAEGWRSASLEGRRRRSCQEPSGSAPSRDAPSPLDTDNRVICQELMHPQALLDPAFGFQGRSSPQESFPRPYVSPAVIAPSASPDRGEAGRGQGSPHLTSLGLPGQSTGALLSPCMPSVGAFSPLAPIAQSGCGDVRSSCFATSSASIVANFASSGPVSSSNVQAHRSSLVATTAPSPSLSQLEVSQNPPPFTPVDLAAPVAGGLEKTPVPPYQPYYPSYYGYTSPYAPDSHSGYSLPQAFQSSALFPLHTQAYSSSSSSPSDMTWAGRDRVDPAPSCRADDARPPFTPPVYPNVLGGDLPNSHQTMPLASRTTQPARLPSASQLAWVAPANAVHQPHPHLPRDTRRSFSSQAVLLHGNGSSSRHARHQNVHPQSSSLPSQGVGEGLPSSPLPENSRDTSGSSPAPFVATPDHDQNIRALGTSGPSLPPSISSFTPSASANGALPYSMNTAVQPAAVDRNSAHQQPEDGRLSAEGVVELSSSSSSSFFALGSGGLCDHSRFPTDGACRMMAMADGGGGGMAGLAGEPRQRPRGLDDGHPLGAPVPLQERTSSSSADMMIPPLPRASPYVPSPFFSPYCTGGGQSSLARARPPPSSHVNSYIEQEAPPSCTFDAALAPSGYARREEGVVTDTSPMVRPSSGRSEATRSSGSGGGLAGSDRTERTGLMGDSSTSTPYRRVLLGENLVLPPLPRPKSADPSVASPSDAGRLPLMRGGEVTGEEGDLPPPPGRAAFPGTARRDMILPHSQEDVSSLVRPGEPSAPSGSFVPPISHGRPGPGGSGSGKETDQGAGSPSFHQSGDASRLESVWLPSRGPRRTGVMPSSQEEVRGRSAPSLFASPSMPSSPPVSPAKRGLLSPSTRAAQRTDVSLHRQVVPVGFSPVTQPVSASSAVSGTRPNRAVSLPPRREHSLVDAPAIRRASPAAEHPLAVHHLPVSVLSGLGGRPSAQHQDFSHSGPLRYPTATALEAHPRGSVPFYMYASLSSPSVFPPPTLYPLTAGRGTLPPVTHPRGGTPAGPARQQMDRAIQGPAVLPSYPLCDAERQYHAFAPAASPSESALVGHASFVPAPVVFQGQPWYGSSGEGQARGGRRTVEQPGAPGGGAGGAVGRCSLGSHGVIGTGQDHRQSMPDHGATGMPVVGQSAPGTGEGRNVGSEEGGGRPSSMGRTEADLVDRGTTFVLAGSGWGASQRTAIGKSFPAETRTGFQEGALGIAGDFFGDAEGHPEKPVDRTGAQQNREGGSSAVALPVPSGTGLPPPAPAIPLAVPADQAVFSSDRQLACRPHSAPGLVESTPSFGRSVHARPFSPLRPTQSGSSSPPASSSLFLRQDGDRGFPDHTRQSQGGLRGGDLIRPEVPPAAECLDSRVLGSQQSRQFSHAGTTQAPVSPQTTSFMLPVSTGCPPSESRSSRAQIQVQGYPAPGSSSSHSPALQATPFRPEWVAPSLAGTTGGASFITQRPELSEGGASSRAEASRGQHALAQGVSGASHPSPPEGRQQEESFTPWQGREELARPQETHGPHSVSHLEDEEEHLRHCLRVQWEHLERQRRLVDRLRAEVAARGARRGTFNEVSSQARAAEEGGSHQHPRGAVGEGNGLASAHASLNNSLNSISLGIRQEEDNNTGALYSRTPQSSSLEARASRATANVAQLRPTSFSLSPVRHSHTSDSASTRPLRTFTMVNTSGAMSVPPAVFADASRLRFQGASGDTEANAAGGLSREARAIERQERANREDGFLWRGASPFSGDFQPAAVAGCYGAGSTFHRSFAMGAGMVETRGNRGEETARIDGGSPCYPAMPEATGHQSLSGTHGGYSQGLGSSLDPGHSDVLRAIENRNASHRRHAPAWGSSPLRSSLTGNGADDAALDAERLREDPVRRVCGGERGRPQETAPISSGSTQGDGTRFSPDARTPPLGGSSASSQTSALSGHGRAPGVVSESERIEDPCQDEGEEQEGEGESSVTPERGSGGGAAVASAPSWCLTWNGEGAQEVVELYEVERIVGVRRLVDGSKRFKVRWKDYVPADDTWEPHEHLEGLEELLQEAEAVLGMETFHAWGHPVEVEDDEKEEEEELETRKARGRRDAGRAEEEEEERENERQPARVEEAEEEDEEMRVAQRDQGENRGRCNHYANEKTDEGDGIVVVSSSSSSLPGLCTSNEGASVELSSCSPHPLSEGGEEEEEEQRGRDVSGQEVNEREQETTFSSFSFGQPSTPSPPSQDSGILQRSDTVENSLPCAARSQADQRTFSSPSSSFPLSPSRSSSSRGACDQLHQQPRETARRTVIAAPPPRVVQMVVQYRSCYGQGFFRLLWRGSSSDAVEWAPEWLLRQLPPQSISAEVRLQMVRVKERWRARQAERNGRAMVSSWLGCV